MRATYDVEAKALYIYVEQGDHTEVQYTEFLTNLLEDRFVEKGIQPPNVYADLGPENSLVGIEILGIELETGP